MNDIEKLIEYIKDHSNNYLGSKTTLKEIETFEYMYDLLIGTLEKQLSGGWIPVSERLPSEEECNKFDVTHPNARKFLCTIKVANYEPQVRTIYFSEIVGWKYSAQDYNEYVIAWRPLPEPYKEVENE